MWYDKTYDRIRCLISKRSGITNSINYNFARIRIDSYDYLPIEKTLTFHSVIILIKSVVNKNENKYHYNIFLEKGLYKDKSNAYYFQTNVCILKMLHFDRIDVSEGTNFNKTSESKKCHIFHYWYSLNKSF